MELDRKDINGSVYYELYVSPGHTVQGISLPSQFFTHENCGGRIYVGDNAHFMCDNCQQESRVENWEIQSYGEGNDMGIMTEEGQKKVNPEEVMSMVGQIVEVAGVDWLKTFLNHMGEF